jgi:hypothetical protein
MWWTFSAAGACALILVALQPLALASPPDSLWVGGVFDADDLDDAVVAVTSAAGVTDGVTVDAVRALWLFIGPLPPSGPIASDGSIFPAFRGRAPPGA